MNVFKKILRFSAVALFPSRCPYCNKVIPDTECACKSCRGQFPEVCCTRYAIGGFLCASPFSYNGVYAKAVKKLKFHNRGDLEIHGELRFDLVTCVPMHYKDKRARGYNQAELLARECAQIMELPYLDTLEKVKRNNPQHKTRGRDRAKNVHSVYALKDIESVRGRNILIIDDIITSGNTLGECARILSKGKCAEIRCAVVCTTVENKFIAPR